MTDKRIPETDSIEELAKFWDTHDLTDFVDEIEEVDEPIVERRRPMVDQDPPRHERVRRFFPFSPVYTMLHW